MTGLASLEARKAMRLAALSVTAKGVSLMSTRCGWKAGSSMLRVALKLLAKPLQVAQDPKIGNFITFQGEEGGAGPVDPLSGRGKAQERGPVNALKPHAGKGPVAFAHPVIAGLPRRARGREPAR